MVTDKKKKLDSLLDYYSETSLNQTIGANWLDDFDSFNKKPFVNKVIAKKNPIHFYSESANWFVDFDSFNIETICRQSDCQEQSD